MDGQSHCLADGANLVRQYVSQLRRSNKLPSDIWPNTHDLLCRTIEYVVVDE